MISLAEDEWSITLTRDRNTWGVEFAQCKHFCLSPALFSREQGERSGCCVCRQDTRVMACSICRRSERRPGFTPPRD